MGRKHKKYKKLKLMTQGNFIVKIMVKRKKPMLNALNRCVEKLSGYPRSLFRFIYDGVRITENATPKSLRMKKHDTIECYEMQDGGCFMHKQSYKLLQHSL